MLKNVVIFLLTGLAITACQTKETATTLSSVDSTPDYYNERHRPQLHFSPKEKWMNDPNGMVFHNGEYHLFYQHFPGGTTWGPMHWGHAISKDLVHWEHMPIALYPDSLGLIFSGSAVVDNDNTSGFGDGTNTPLVAIFTYHDMEKEKAGATDYQFQGIAYSLDNGRSWSKYENNPVLPNQGIKDFRDPKVLWHEASKKWVMILAVKDHVELWGSKNLKEWDKLSDFGFEYGAHGGVWECPDLFPLTINGATESKWVMIVSLNPGGPNGGSATQYFIGDFDGKTFKPDADKTSISWLDYGPDNYAGVTWFNAPSNRKIFMGWMSNWAYADKVPTERWRSALTTPRDLSLVRTTNGLRVTSQIAEEFKNAAPITNTISSQEVDGTISLNGEDLDLSKSVITGAIEAKSFRLEFSNSKNQFVTISYSESTKAFTLDRASSGDVKFSENFKGIANAPRLINAKDITFTVVADNSSIEVFFDDGLTVLTALLFPDEPLSIVKLHTTMKTQVGEIQIRKMNSIWNNQ